MASEEHEIWKPIKKYEGWYEISNLGRVRSVVHVWPSAHECARAGFSYGNVCACCRGERNMHKGYRWKYV